MIDYAKIAGHLDSIADRIEAAGLKKEALAIDAVSDTIEAMSKFTPQVVELARSLGINLNAPGVAAKIVAENFDPKATAELGAKEALMNPKAKSLAFLAALLVSNFIGSVEAKGKPITVRFPTGVVTYNAQDLKQLEKGDPKSFAVVMDAYEKQQAEAASTQEISKSNEDRMRGQEKPQGYDKSTKNVEEMSDEFGNKARLITYTDGTKMLEGDMYHGGTSLRDKLTKSGDIPHDPSAKHLPRKA